MVEGGEGKEESVWKEESRNTGEAVVMGLKGIGAELLYIYAQLLITL